MKNALGLDATLITGSGGAFEVVADGTLIFSKLALGRFPNPGEIVGMLM